MPPKQKALLLTRKHGDFELGETEIYIPGSGEVLIKIQATSLNPVDWKIRKYGFHVKNFPGIVGTDIAGDVKEVGEGVKEFKKGDKVFVHGIFENRGASFQQYTIAPAAIVARIPDNLTYDQASALPVALSCAYIGLYNVLPRGLGLTPPVSAATQGIFSDTPIVILGGATSVGQLMIQFAKLSGFSHIITTASLKHVEFLKSLGATHILDRNLPTSSLIGEIREITDNTPIRYVYDNVASATTQQQALDILASEGHAISTLPATVTIPEDKTMGFAYADILLPHNFNLCST